MISITHHQLYKVNNRNFKSCYTHQEKRQQTTRIQLLQAVQLLLIATWSWKSYNTIDHVRLAWRWRDEDGVVKVMVLASVTVGHLMMQTHLSFPPRNWRLKLPQIDQCVGEWIHVIALPGILFTLWTWCPWVWVPFLLFILTSYVCCLYYYIIKDVYLSLYSRDHQGLGAAHEKISPKNQPHFSHTTMW